MKLNIEEIPQGHIEGYLIKRSVLGYKRPLHYFTIADDILNKETHYHMPKQLNIPIDTYMGEYICLSKINNKIVITPGGCPE